MLLIPQLLLHSGLISKKSFFLVKDIVTESTPTMWLWSEILAIGKPFSGSLSFPHNNYFSKNLQICFFKKRTSIFSIDWVPQFWLKRRSSLLCFFYLNYSPPPPPPPPTFINENLEHGVWSKPNQIYVSTYRCLRNLYQLTTGSCKTTRPSIIHSLTSLERQPSCQYLGCLCLSW
jgi:hypothetical protein